MPSTHLTCPSCGSPVRAYQNPVPTVDIIIRIDWKIVLIERKNPPHGWALPGGFVDYGETLEDAAIREAREETSLTITTLRLLGCYSDPSRDDRLHTISTVFVADGHGLPQAADDARSLILADPRHPPAPLCFDHGQIISDYCRSPLFLPSSGSSRR